MKKIVVSLTRKDSVKDIMPCLELLTKPGMAVIFLFPYPAEWLPYVCDYWVTTESVGAAVAAGKTLAQRYSCEMQTELAREITAQAAADLTKRRVQVEVHFYGDSLRRVLRDYGADKDVVWMIRDVPRRGWLRHLLIKSLLPSGWSGQLLSGRVDPRSARSELTAGTLYRRVGASAV